MKLAVALATIPFALGVQNPSECPIVELDFNNLENPAWRYYNQEPTLKAGDYLFDQLWFKYGVRVSARVRDDEIYKKDYDNRIFIPKYDRENDDWVQAKNDTVPGDITTGGAIRLFDTYRPTGNKGQPLCSGGDGDLDLGAPNDSCGGPGTSRPPKSA